MLGRGPVRLRLPIPEEPTGAGTRSIFFSRFWVVAAIITLVAGMASGLAALSLAALFVLCTAGLTWAWNRYCFEGLSFERKLSAQMAFPGDHIHLTVTVVNRKPLPVVGLTVEDELAEALNPEDWETTIGIAPGRRLIHFATSVRPFERVTWHIRLSCDRRGYHVFGPSVLRAGDPFGFFTTRRTTAKSDALVIYPRVHQIEEILLPARQPFGETRVAHHLLTDPARIVGIRDYRPEDPFRGIHWKATARLMRLQVKVEEPVTAPQLGIFVNLDTFDHYWEGLDVEVAELAIEIAASIAVYADAQRFATGIYANGIVAGSDQALRVAPGRGPSQVPRILDGLAKLTPYSTVNFASVLRAETTRFPWGSTLVVVTRMMPEPLQAQLASLIGSGMSVVLVPIEGCPIPEIRGLIVREVKLTADITPVSA
jgi:uncharacterized protein (DUF58 family)